MAVEDRTRHDRLRSLLPAVYATDPKHSALGVLLEVLADALREADGLTERALRDRWLRTAQGARDLVPAGEQTGEVVPLPTVSLAGAPHPVELLGAALGLRRQPWEVDENGYRSRVRILAPMLSRGLATPRVMLAFSLTSLHAEPCPVLEHPTPGSTRGYGLPPRSLDKCRVCRGGQTPPPGSTCPLRDQATMSATVTDNPRTRGKLIRSRLDPIAGTTIRVHSDSLFSARPAITLTLPADAGAPVDEAVIVRLYSQTTGEELILPVPLIPGDTLVVRPASPWDPNVARHRQYWVDPPAGEHALPPRAWIVRTADDSIVPVDDVLMYTSGARFGRALFAGFLAPAQFGTSTFDDAGFDVDAPQTDPEGPLYRFVEGSVGVQTPELRAGDNTWQFSTLTPAELASIATDYDLPPELVLPSSLPTPTTPLRVELKWWTRPPARFRIRVPRKPAVESALALGAADYLRRLVERVRPAGVHPIIDFAVEPIVEVLDPEVEALGWEVRGGETVDPTAELAAVTTPTPPTGTVIVDPNESAGFIGVFDVTPFEFSLFADLEVGTFDTSQFGMARFA